LGQPRFPFVHRTDSNAQHFRKLFLRQCALFSERSDILCKLVLHLLRFPPFFGGIFALRL
jgi:hypothetical protein